MSEQATPDRSADGPGSANLGGDCAAPGCSEILAQVYSYVDGELTESARTLMLRHLDECSGCWEVVDFEVHVKTVIARRGRTQCPEVLKERLLALLRNPPTDPASA